MEKLIKWALKESLLLWPLLNSGKVNSLEDMFSAFESEKLAIIMEAAEEAKVTLAQLVTWAHEVSAEKSAEKAEEIAMFESIATGGEAA